MCTTTGLKANRIPSRTLPSAVRRDDKVAPGGEPAAAGKAGRVGRWLKRFQPRRGGTAEGCSPLFTNRRNNYGFLCRPAGALGLALTPPFRLRSSAAAPPGWATFWSRLPALGLFPEIGAI